MTHISPSENGHPTGPVRPNSIKIYRQTEGCTRLILSPIASADGSRFIVLNGVLFSEVCHYFMCQLLQRRFLDQWKHPRLDRCQLWIHLENGSFFRSDERRVGKDCSSRAERW